MTTSTALVCLQCGSPASRPDARTCRRCGLRLGEAPPANARLATCPICYRETDPDGRIASLSRPVLRLDLHAHIDEHDRHPVGDDAWLETLREQDMIRIGRWLAPFDMVREYLVTGAYDAGRNRLVQHDALVMAMTQLQRWGRNAEVFGDQESWRAAREAVSELMDRYHREGAGFRR